MGYGYEGNAVQFETSDVAESFSSAITSLQISRLRGSRSSSIGKGHLDASKSLLKTEADPEKVIPRTLVQRLKAASIHPISCKLTFTCEDIPSQLRLPWP